MDFGLSAAQRQSYDRVLAEVRSCLGEPSLSPDACFTQEQWKIAGDLGLTGLCLPVVHGGSGFGALDTALSLEAFGRGCPNTGLVFAVAAHLLACAVPVRDFASDDLQARLLPGFASGDLIAGNAMTEDGAGSDIAAIAVTAVRDGDSYILRGEKSFVSNAPSADVLVTYAVTDPAAGFLGLSAFAVPADMPGIAIEPTFRKMGLSGCPAARVQFSDCRVPASCLIGEEGAGGVVFQHSMAWERACLFSAYVGLMDRQLELCVERARHRRQFGRSIGEFQAVSHRLVTMRQRLEGARLLLYRACWTLEHDLDDGAAVALAKLAVSEATVSNSLDALQIFGGVGYLVGTEVEQQLRDCIPTSIFSGTNDIQRELVARDMGL